MMRKIPRQCLLGLVALAGMATSCSETEVSSYLIASLAQRQPKSPSLGAILFVQQRGGAEIRLRVEAGTLELSADAPNKERQQDACVKAPANDTPLYLSVLPKESEAVLFVDLLGPRDDKDAACSGSPLQHQVVTVTVIPQATAEPPAGNNAGSGGGGGTGGAGGVGGTGP